MGKQKMKFEDALSRLEQIVSQIEKGDISLEESIERYAEGIALVEACRSILDQSERKIQLLAKREGGDVEPVSEVEEPPDEPQS